MKRYLRQELRRRPGQYAISLTVLALLAAFSELLLSSVAILLRAMTQSLGPDESLDGTVAVALHIVAWVFLGIAIVVTCLVVFNAFGMVYAGRLRDYAVIRLIGGKSASIRRASSREGATIGLVGGALGLILGSAVIVIGLAILNGRLHASLEFPVNAEIFVVPLLVPIVASAIASRKASARVASLHPADGMRQAGLQHDPGRPRLWGLWLFLAGTIIMIAGFRIGLVTIGGLLVAFPGGVLSIIGVIGAAQWYVPNVIRLAAWLFPGRIGRVSAANIRHDRVRTARTTVSVIIGVALLTMFVVAGAMYMDFMGKMFALQGAPNSEIALKATQGILTCIDVLVGFSVLIAVLGMAASMAMSVLQRRTEIGTLRALGMRRGQVRQMLTVESLLTTVVGIIIGVTLGIWFGYVGANSLLASTVIGPLPLIISPMFVVSVCVGAVVLGVVTSIVPSRTALKVQPAEALRVL